MLNRPARPAQATKDVEGTFAPLKAIRKARQKPAHAAKAPTTDADAFVRQREVLIDLAKSVEAIRRFLQRHPAVISDDCEPHDYLDNWLTV